MLIQNDQNATNGVFYLEENGERLAEMVYAIEENKMIIEHTEVDESLRGKNIGFQLVERGVEFAREAHLTIVPKCKFARKVMEEHKEFQDVL